MNINDNIPNSKLLEHELSACGIKVSDGIIKIRVDNNPVMCASIDEALKLVKTKFSQTKQNLFEKWQMLGHLASEIVNKPAYNDVACLGNILFLHNVKTIHVFSLLFDELEETSKSIRALFDVDIASINHSFIEQFNDMYLEIKILHTHAMREIYRMTILKQYTKLNKTASISGPWSNLDLPMLERAYPWYPEEEEYQSQRTTARQKQSRYNPEYSSMGHYFDWVDVRNSPYRFGEWAESPYPSRNQLHIP